MKALELSGKQFGRWTVIEKISNTKPVKWACRCECGTTKEVYAQALTRGTSRSCGCYRKEFLSDLKTVHTKKPTKLYNVWNTMRRRCDNKNVKSFSDYGGRGIKVCAEWNESFETFRDWAFESGYKEGLEIDRIDVDGNYSPDNCRWVSRQINANNKRNNHRITINGETKTLGEWCKEYGINRKTVQSRISYGWKEDESLFIPAIQGRNQTWQR